MPINRRIIVQRMETKPRRALQTRQDDHPFAMDIAVALFVAVIVLAVILWLNGKVPLSF